MDNTILYQALTGSRAYGTDVPKSDTDYFMIVREYDKIPYSIYDEKLGKIEYMQYTPVAFLNGVFRLPFLLRSPGAFISLYSEPLTQNNLSDYLVANRESIMSANKKRVGYTFNKFIADRWEIEQASEVVDPKRLAAMVTFSTVLTQLPIADTMQQAIILPEEIQELAKTLKIGFTETDIELAHAIILQGLQSYENNNDFYSQESPEILKKHKNELIEIFEQEGCEIPSVLINWGCELCLP